MRRGGEEQSYLRSYLRVIFVYIGKRAEITSFTLFALPPYVGYPPPDPEVSLQYVARQDASITQVDLTPITLYLLMSLMDVPWVVSLLLVREL